MKLIRSYRIRYLGLKSDDSNRRKIELSFINPLEARWQGMPRRKWLDNVEKKLNTIFMYIRQRSVGLFHIQNSTLEFYA